MGFADIQTSDWTVKAMFGCVAVALVGGGLTAFYAVSGTNQGKTEDMLLKCMDCQVEKTYDSKAFRDLSTETTTAFVDKTGNAGGVMGGPNWGITLGYKCPDCGKGGVDQVQDGKPHGLYIHYKCPHDGTVFFSRQDNLTYPDTCPKCNVSPSKQKTDEILKTRKK